MVGQRGSSAGSYLADPTSPATVHQELRVNVTEHLFMLIIASLIDSQQKIRICIGIRSRWRLKLQSGDWDIDRIRKD